MALYGNFLLKIGKKNHDHLRKYLALPCLSHIEFSHLSKNLLTETLVIHLLFCKLSNFSSIAELHGSKSYYRLRYIFFFQNSLHFAMCKLPVAIVLYTYFILMLFRKFLISLYRNFVVPTMFECTTNVSYVYDSN